MCFSFNLLIMKESVFVRRCPAPSSVVDVVPSVELLQTRNFEVKVGENGERKFEISEPVKPALVQDFSASILSLRSRSNSPVLGRIQRDPVDLQNDVQLILNL